MEDYKLIEEKFNLGSSDILEYGILGYSKADSKNPKYKNFVFDVEIVKDIYPQKYNIKIYEKKTISLSNEEIIKQDINKYISDNDIDLKIIYSEKPFNDETFKYIGSGVPHVVYFDTSINKIIKFKKHERDKYSNIRPSNETDILHTKNIGITNIKNFIFNLNNIMKIIKDNDSFLQIEGFIIYFNIISNTTKDNYEAISFSPTYNYLDNYVNLNREVFDMTNTSHKLSFIKLINDYKKIYDLGYIHGDFQYNCNNLMFNNVDNKIKIIDIDSINTISNKGGETYRDFVSFAKCLHELGYNDYSPKITELSKENNIDEIVQIIKNIIFYNDINKKYEDSTTEATVISISVAGGAGGDDRAKEDNKYYKKYIKYKLKYQKLKNIN